MSDSQERFSDLLDGSPKENYERRPEKKWRDFLLGIGLNVVIIFFGYLLTFSLLISQFKYSDFYWFIPLFIPLIAAIFYFVSGRKYFGLGVIGGYIVVLLLALLAFGACMMMISSAYSG